MRLKAMKSMTVAPEKAQDMLNEWGYDRQREVNPTIVGFYAEQMLAGDFLQYTDIEVAWVANGDGKSHGYLTNGQHRLHAVLRCGMPQKFVIKEYDCDSKDEVAMLYGLTDINKPRNINDLVRAHGAKDSGLRQYQITKTSAALTLINADFGMPSKYTLSPARRLEMLERYTVPAQSFFEAFGNGGMMRYLARNAGSLAVALATFDESIKVYGEAKIVDFWSGISANDGLRKGDPRKIVVDFVVQRAVTSNVGKTRATPQYISRYVANCWNAWSTDRELTFSRVLDVKSPILIRGTRWNGK